MDLIKAEVEAQEEKEAWLAWKADEIQQQAEEDARRSLRLARRVVIKMGTPVVTHVDGNVAPVELWDCCACDAVLGMAPHRTEFT